MQNEKKHATIFFKRAILASSLKIKRFLWTFFIDNKPEGQGDLFDHKGMLYPPSFRETIFIKKLSYYTYKKMVEVLDGFDWDNVQTIQEKDGVYVYKFIKNNKPIYVAWNDNSKIKTIILNIDNIRSVKITEAIPKYKTGKEVKDYSTDFEVEFKQTINGKVTISLGENPVFVEKGQ